MPYDREAFEPRCAAGPINRHKPGSFEWFDHEARRPENAGNVQFFIDSATRAREREEREQREYTAKMAAETWEKAKPFVGMGGIEFLMALLKSVEFVPSCCYDGFCPFCGDCQSYGQNRHHQNCPAFTPDGQVRLIAVSEPTKEQP